jgi:hypothetical protein
MSKKKFLREQHSKDVKTSVVTLSWMYHRKKTVQVKFVQRLCVLFFFDIFCRRNTTKSCKINWLTSGKRKCIKGANSLYIKRCLPQTTSIFLRSSVIRANHNKDESSLNMRREVQEQSLGPD